MDARCNATRRDGQPSPGRALEDGFCFAHSAKLREARARGNTRGGQNRSTATRLAKAMPQDIREVTDLLVSSLTEVHDGVLSPRQGTAMAVMATSIARLVEVHDQERRLARIEAADRDVS